MPLTEEQKTIIKATVPILQTGGETLTKHFYGVMLKEYPEVVPFFNMSHQRTGDQPRALAHSVLMYAKHIDNLEAIGPLAGQIINKHVALAVRADHYPIVGACLLRSIREVLFSFPDDTVVWSGHGEQTTIGREKRTNPFLS